jgi:putative sterol carrier protein
MVKYFSEEFFGLVEEKLGSDEEFTKSISDVDTSILLVSEDPDASFLLPLADGEISVQKTSPDESAEFKVIGPYEEWVRSAKGEASLTRQIMAGKLKVKGSMSKMMFYWPKIQGIEDTLKEIETEF